MPLNPDIILSMLTLVTKQTRTPRDVMLGPRSTLTRLRPCGFN